MNELNLGFKLFEKDYHDGFPVWFLEKQSGLRRRASPEEVVLWQVVRRLIAEAAEAAEVRKPESTRKVRA